MDDTTKFFLDAYRSLFEGFCINEEIKKRFPELVKQCTDIRFKVQAVLEFPENFAPINIMKYLERAEKFYSDHRKIFLDYGVGSIKVKQ